MTVKRESDLLIMSMITNGTGQHKVLLPINQDYDKSLERNLTMVITGKLLTWQNVSQQYTHMMYTVHIHKDDVPTFQLQSRGVLPIMAYTGRLCPKGVPFSDFRYIRG